MQEQYFPVVIRHEEMYMTGIIRSAESVWETGKMDRKKTVTAVFFTIACFVYTTTMSMLNRDIAGNVEGRHMFLYMLQSLTLAVGLMLYPFMRQTIGISAEGAKILSAVSGVVYSACILSAGFINSYPSIIAIMILIPISMGYCVGMAYVRFAHEMRDSSLIGRAFGTALGISIFMQYLLQILWDIGMALFLIMCVMCISLIVWGMKTGADQQDDNRTGVKTDGPTFQNRLFLRLIIAAACFDILAVYLDGQMELAFDTADFFSWPRLLYGAAFILMGFLWDMGKGRAVTAVMMIAAIASILMPVLLLEERFYIFDICFFYFYLGLCLVYNSLKLMLHDTAKENMYAAVSYRVIDNLLTAFLVLVRFSALPLVPALLIDIALLAVIVILLVRDDEFNNAGRQRSYENADDKMVEFASRYGLTERESEVFSLLMTRDEKGDDMAKELGVSRRGFVSLASSIYRKTDTGSRVALLQKYMSEQ